MTYNCILNGARARLTRRSQPATRPRYRSGMSSRQNSATALIVDEAILLPRRAAAELMSARGVNFRTVVRVLDRAGRRRQSGSILRNSATQGSPSNSARRLTAIIPCMPPIGPSARIS